MLICNSYVVVDGTYITKDRLEVNGTGPAAHVPVMMGIMRDDGDPFISLPTTTDVTQALNALPVNGSLIESSGAFPEPSGPNATFNVFNVTSRVATDSEFRCIDYASAYAAVQNDVFDGVYFYEFNRSYQLAVYNPNPPVRQSLTFIDDTMLTFIRRALHQRQLPIHSAILLKSISNAIQVNYILYSELWHSTVFRVATISIFLLANLPLIRGLHLLASQIRTLIWIICTQGGTQILVVLYKKPERGMLLMIKRPCSEKCSGRRPSYLSRKQSSAKSWDSH
jgi:hypothetical protein